MDNTANADLIRKYWPEWHIVKQLGHGSFGDVYDCEKADGVTEPTQFGLDQQLSPGGMAVKHSAVKVIAIPQYDSQIAMMRAEGIPPEEIGPYYKKIAEDCIKEIKTMESLKSCPNVVYIEDFKVARKEDSEGWVILIRMELLTGLPDYMQAHAMNEADILRLGIDICSALRICHESNIIHRDIKPGNIMVNKYGVFKLADFGIARELDKSEMGMSKKGTYSYMAPEMEMMDTYDHRVDLYALGIVLYQLLNRNRAPFLDPLAPSVSYEDKQRASMRRIMGESFPPPLNGSEATKQAVMKACAYQAKDRFASADEMQHALQQALHRLSAAPTDDAPTEIGQPAHTPRQDGDETAFAAKPPQPERTNRPSRQQDTDATAIAKKSEPLPNRNNNVPFIEEIPLQGLQSAEEISTQKEEKPKWISWVIFLLNICGAIAVFYAVRLIVPGATIIGWLLVGAGALAAIAIIAAIIKLAVRAYKKKQHAQNGTVPEQKTPAQKKRKRDMFALGCVMVTAIISMIYLHDIFPSYFVLGKLPDVTLDIDRFSFTVDGDTIQLPARVNDLKEKGWKISTAEYDFFWGGMYSDSTEVHLKKGGLLLLASQKTFDNEDYITGISVSPDNKLVKSDHLHFSNQFTISGTTLREIYTIYSKNTNGGSFGGSADSSINYENTGKGLLTFFFSNIDDIYEASEEDLDRALLSGVEMTAVDLESAQRSFPTSDYLPEVYFDMDTFIMRIEDDEYQFPITVSEFEALGWKLTFQDWNNEGIPDTIAPGEAYLGTVSAVHTSGAEISICTIQNFTNNIQALRDCHISGVILRSDLNTVSMDKLRLSHGLTLGETTQAELRGRFPSINGNGMGGDEVSCAYTRWDLAEVEFYFRGAENIDDQVNGVLSGFGFRTFTDNVNAGKYEGNILYYLTTESEGY